MDSLRSGPDRLHSHAVAVSGRMRCLAAAGGFERICLATTVILYLAALIRSAIEGEKLFREASASKHAADDLTVSMDMARERADRTLCLMLLDLDGFKSINDQGGILTTLSACVFRCASRGDIRIAPVTSHDDDRQVAKFALTKLHIPKAMSLDGIRQAIAELEAAQVKPN